MAEVAVSSQSVRNRMFIPSVYIKTTPSFVLVLRKKKETANTDKTAISFFHAQDIRLSSIRPLPLTMGSHYPHGSSGVEPLDFERCVRKINVSYS